ncbi:MAG TPA: MlaE family lipid ABC transporter permease subunit [Candidatus Cloacimonadota bacterium]|jgi:phospholipid/cholesterol/gamma-HCH transport system permease protein|nr:MlaE family lipid ABC transporter permease subunit [Candidatus Cloacimonadota bacterium]HOR58549.1 MlaE family lipid ABC transporter permease subunit [Candidatus Cloacimonadota bacterium]HPB09002.1 MlaE family lipid ABC transporter permease subunit [Candidatus Cloacimonadota bacterium]HQL12762.1 MlaE family lipid ABC transporter permease subunit [Candidatus Cloacimonadota bacterium]HQP17985.1 MlaE family lipid ABC transporter permease subunit [Candidatus Cloacimonadota bacterium]
MLKLSFHEGLLRIEGSLVAPDIPSLHSELEAVLKSKASFNIDLSGLTGIDSAGVAFLEELTLKAAQKGALIIHPPSAEIQSVMDTFRSLDLPTVEPRPKQGFLESAGENLLIRLDSFKNAIMTASEVVWWSIIGIFDRSGQRKYSIVQQGLALGFNAMPIIALMSFIIGFILSLQSAVQLRIYGANIFLADLLAITMVREMGPLITAILVAGRSGSAIASEIASMNVSEELDALRMMALDPVRFVVVPKFHAITLVMPVLVLLAIIAGEIGGAVIAFGYLDLSVSTFLSRSFNILTLKDLIITFTKSTVFAWLIVIIGAHYGFQTTGGAEGVGKATTASVVSSIFAIVIADSLFSLLYI